MHEPKGRYLPITGPRRFIIDLVHFAHKVPSTPVSRTFDVSPLFEPGLTASRPALLGVPVHEGLCPGRGRPPPASPGATGVPLAAALRAPLDELCPGDRADVPGRGRGLRRPLPGTGAAELAQLQEALSWYKNQPLEKVGFYRLALRFSQVPTPVRRLLWWSTLNVSGFKRGKRFGTFGLTQLRRPRGRVAAPDLAADHDPDFGPIIRPADGRRQADLRPPRARRRLHRPPAPRHRGRPQRRRSSTSCRSDRRSVREASDGPLPTSSRSEAPPAER